jgi:hypothetical protein
MFAGFFLCFLFVCLFVVCLCTELKYVMFVSYTRFCHGCPCYCIPFEVGSWALENFSVGRQQVGSIHHNIEQNSQMSAHHPACELTLG